MLFNPAHEGRFARRARTESLVATIAVAVLGLIALVCAAMIVPILWTAITESEPKQGCEWLKDPAQRLSCFDARQAPSHPAKGAIAPLGPAGAAQR